MLDVIRVAHRDGGSALRVWTPPDWPTAGVPDRGLAVEVRRHRGGIMTYALVGGVPSERSEIETGATGEPFADALLTDGRTWFGLPDEYREAVCQVLSRVERSLPVRITLAAHDEVGSSLVAFYEATTALVVAMATGEPGLGRTGDALWKLMDDEVVASPFHR